MDNGVVYIVLLVSLLVQTIPVTLSQTVMLSNSRNILCPGTEVIFTCVITGSMSMEWHSREYIGPSGARLQFNTLTSPGSTQTGPVYPSTVATLINMTNENGVAIIQTQLRIVTLADFPTASVMCYSFDAGMNSSTVRVFGYPDMPQNITSNLRNDSLTGECTILVAWNAPTNIAVAGVLDYIVYIDGENVVNETSVDGRELTIGAYRVCSCDTHNVSVSAINVCGLESRRTPTGMVGSEDTKDLPFSDECQRGNSGTIEDCPKCTPDCWWCIIVIIVLAVLCVLLAIGFLVSLIFLTKYKREKLPSIATERQDTELKLN